MNGITNSEYKYIKDKFPIPKKDEDTQYYKYDSSSSFYIILTQKLQSIYFINIIWIEVVTEIKEEKKEEKPELEKGEDKVEDNEEKEKTD